MRLNKSSCFSYKIHKTFLCVTVPGPIVLELLKQTIKSHVTKSVFTFSLDLEHTDGILRAEGAELAGRQRVAAAPRPR